MADFSLEMFWGGAPAPLNTPDEALAQMREKEFTLRDESESDQDLWDPATGYYNPQTGETGVLTEEQLKPGRVFGGLAAVSKPVSANYDTDDARIIDLKQQGYPDEYVAGVLIEEGRMRYHSKTVGSRWLRLRKILEKYEDERLDDELSDWHIGEDEMLRDMKEEVDKKYAEAMRNLEKKKWQDVSIYLANKTKTRKYTAKACRERFDGLMDGSAMIPVELDDDQEGRRKLRDERIAAARARRIIIDAERKVVAASKVTRVEDKKQAKIDAIKHRQKDILRREDERKKHTHIRDKKEVTRITARILRDKLGTVMRRREVWEKAKLEIELEIYKGITGNDLPRKLPSGARRRPSKRQRGTDVDSDSDNEDQDVTIGIGPNSDEDTDDEEYFRRADSVANETGRPIKKRILPARRASLKPSSLIEPDSESDGEVTVNGARPTANRPQVFTKALVTRESLLNPRTICSNLELREIFERRNIIPARQDDESHAEVVARLAEYDASLHVVQLKQVCRSEHVSPVGRKHEFVARLAENDAASSFARRRHGMKSTDIHFMMTYNGYEGECQVYLDEAKQAARERGETILEDSDYDDEDDDESMMF